MTHPGRVDSLTHARLLDSDSHLLDPSRGDGPEEIVFDHPTPLDTPGTLRRTLESLTPLVTRGAGVEVSVVAAATAPALEAAVAHRVREVIESPPLPYPVKLLAAPHLRLLQDFCRNQGQAEWLPLLSLAGYAQIRNLTLILANICRAGALLSLDDDEVIADPDFLVKVAADLELLEREHPVFGLAGIYRNGDGSVLLPEPGAPWAVYWPKMRWLNAALTGTGVGRPPPETHLPRVRRQPGGAGGPGAFAALRSCRHPG